MSISVHTPMPVSRGWVAVVDDDASIRRSLARVCRGYDIPVLTFESAEAFLERRPSSAPRCLVLDVNLGPGLDGFQLQQRLESEGGAPPIIFVTGRPETNARIGAQSRHAYGFLQKPIEIDTLLALLRRRLDAPAPSGAVWTDGAHAPTGVASGNVHSPSSTSERGR